MSQLTQDNPTILRIDGVDYPINTDSRNILLTLEAFDAAHSGELLPCEAWELFYENIFTEPYPPDELKAFEVFEKFLRRCETIDNDHPQTMDFIQDGKFIYDAFLSSGLSNQEIKSMHWWDLISRLSELHDTTFNRIVYLRMKLQGIGGKISKEERQECERIGWDVINIQRNQGEGIAVLE